MPAGPRRELLRARAAFLSACGWGSRRSILASLEDRDRQLVQALTDGQPGGAVVRARPVRPASAGRRAGAGRPGRHAGTHRGGLVSRQARLPRPRRADRGRARDALAGPGARPPGHAGRRGLGLGCRAPPRPVRARRGRPGGPPRAAVPGARAAPAARGAARPGRRPVRHRTAGAAGHRGGCGHAGRGLPGRAGPGGRAVPRRRVVLPRAGRPGRRPGPAGRDAGRRPPAAAPAAGRHPRLRPAAAPADPRRRAGPGRPAGPGRAAGPGPLAGRHAPHPGHGLALGPRRPSSDRARPVTARARAHRPRRPGYR